MPSAAAAGSVRGVLPNPTRPLAARVHPPITELVAEAIAARPAATLLEQGERHWSYAEFATRGEEFAEALYDAGHPAGAVLAIVTPHRGFDLYAALYAAWLAGAVPMIVDAGLPAERQQLMLEHARASTVIALDTDAEHLPQGATQLAGIGVEHDYAPRLARPVRSADRAFIERRVLRPDDPAYIFFTSGSTGTPKGFVGRHNGLSHMLLWQRDRFCVGEHDRCAQVISMRADALLRDIFTPIISGSCLCLPSDPRVLGPDPSLPLAWMRDAAVTLAHSVPTLALTWLAGSGEVGQLDALRLLFFSGEALSSHLAGRLHALAPNVELVNLYGVSECTMFQTYQRLPRLQSGIQPVGVGIDGAQALVLSPTGHLCEVEQPGELYLRTPYATLGYLSNEHNQAFVANPFLARPNERLFRTGDEGRYLATGSLAVHGRLKHRPRAGFPALAAEDISGVLDQHPAIRLSAVLVAEDPSGRARYDAYVVPAADATTNADELRRFLRDHVSAEFAPICFYSVPRLPLTATGKLDRSQLRASDHDRLPATTPP